jgi:hypothetical protein
LGSVLEERYERLDDGRQPGRATLKKVWQLWWSREDGASTVLPYEGASIGWGTRARARR